MQLTDTHCHIQSINQGSGEEVTRSLWAKAPGLTAKKVIQMAANEGVDRLICVGCTLEDSKLAIRFAKQHENVWASVGIHPHEAKHYAAAPSKLRSFCNLLGEKDDRRKIVAIGECGLDYYYEHSPKSQQEKLLRLQLELALDHNLPLIFHVREAFADFWKVFDDYKGAKGVVHSFSAGRKELDEILSRDLYVGLNGIMTFTRDEEQLEAAKAVPLEKLLLETDSPFLTPTPYRGTICEPKHVRTIAAFLAGLRGETLEQLGNATNVNSSRLFGLS